MKEESILILLTVFNYIVYVELLFERKIIIGRWKVDINSSNVISFDFKQDQID